MSVPSSTYRLQLHADFGFEHARALVPYFHALGISHLYLSPIFQARAGSTHGYDVTDPTRVNAEIGTIEELRALAADLRSRGMGILLDIVPNHMAADVQNPWWRDVLEHGPSSPYAGHFDIDWGAGNGRLLLPILGRHYGDVIEDGELGLQLGPDGLSLAYFQTRLPLDPATWPEALEKAGDEVPDGLRDVLNRLGGLPPRDEARGAAADHRYWESQAIKADLWARHEAEVDIRSAVDRALAAYDVAREGADAAKRLDELLARQAYLPTFWRSASEEINYRRFFDITDLAGVRVEEPEVFADTHRLILGWLEDGTIAGARVDHVDGLYDPTDYLQRLAREATTPDGPPYVLVEKILAREERLPDDWPVAGTTGYDSLNLINGAFVDPQGLRAAESAFRGFTGDQGTFQEVVYRAKRQVMKELFGGEVHTLVGALIAVAHHDLHGRDLPAPALGRALQEVTAALPVYRTYARSVDGCPVVSERDEAVLRETFAEARRRNPTMDPGVFAFLERVLLVSPRDETAAGRLAFLMRWQQLTGPIMAKGLEDTALYRWAALLSACDVGSWPPIAAVARDELHERMAEVAMRWPHSMNSLSTHDTKRSGDARARLNVLTEIPDEWAAALERWTALNRDKRVELEGGPAPSPLGELSIYQMLLAIRTTAGPDAENIAERLKDAILKSAREAKLRTGWHHPSEEYERHLLDFVDAMLADDRFMGDFTAFEERIAPAGMVNALSQTLLEMTLPGVPDIYQGSETWRLSLVDPDNRRPVDFELRRRMLDEVLPSVEHRETSSSVEHRETSSSAEQHDAPGSMLELEHEHDSRLSAVNEWLRDWRDGRIKLHVTAAGLRFRREHGALFAQGDYLPLDVSGAAADCMIAFARRAGDDWCIVLAPRFTTRVGGGAIPLGGAWRDTTVALPPEAPARWHDVLSGGSVAAHGSALRLADALATLPLALLRPE